MTIKLDNARDTFRSHVYSRPLSQPGMEMYNSGNNVRSRRNHSLSPVIGRDTGNVGEEYFGIQRDYVVRFEDFRFSCELEFETEAITMTSDYVGAGFILENSSSILEVHFDSGTDTSADLYVDPMDFNDLQDWTGFLDEVVNRINGQFELQDGLLIDAYTHAATRPWVALRRDNRIEITNNLSDESGFVITPIDPNTNVFVNVIDFPDPADKKKWYKSGDRKVETNPLAFYDGFVSDRLQLVDPGRELGDQNWPSGIAGAETVNDLNNENLQNNVTEDVGFVKTLETVTLSQDWKREDILGLYQQSTETVDQESWFGESSTTWSFLSSAYEHIGIDSAIEKMLFTDYSSQNVYKDILDIRGRTRYDGSYRYDNGDLGVSGRSEYYELDPIDSVFGAKDHRPGGWRTQDLHRYEDMIDVNDNEYSIFDKEYPNPGWLDEDNQYILYQNSNLIVAIELPLVNSEITYADNYREMHRSSRIDSEMLSTVFINSETSWSSNRIYYRDESIYTDVGRTSNPSLPSQGIIYTDIAK